MTNLMNRSVTERLVVRKADVVCINPAPLNPACHTWVLAGGTAIACVPPTEPVITVGRGEDANVRGTVAVRCIDNREIHIRRIVIHGELPACCRSSVRGHGGQPNGHRVRRQQENAVRNSAATGLTLRSEVTGDKNQELQETRIKAPTTNPRK